MNSLKIMFLKFVKNKNTVTILGAVVITGILYFNYNLQINRAIAPVSVPVARVTIDQKTKVTKAMVKMIDMAPIMLGNSVIRSKEEILDKYTNYNFIVPKGSLFYSETGLLVSTLPDSIYVDLDKTLIPFNLDVTLATTYGNSITPNSIVDIYMKAYDENNTLMVGKLIANAKVLAVKDGSGRNVFEASGDEVRTPSKLLFAFDKETQALIRKATYLSSNDVELFPVPVIGLTEDEKGTIKPTVSTQHLKDFIESITYSLSEDDLLVTVEDKEE